jgi:hypothetical protein
MRWITNCVAGDADVFRSLDYEIGPPKPIDGHTQEQLEEIGIVGVYDPVDSMVMNIDWSNKSDDEQHRLVIDMESREQMLKEEYDQYFSQTPAKKEPEYRRRWSGGKYIYEEIDSACGS